MPETTTVPTAAATPATAPAAVAKKANPVVAFFTELWNKIESVDASVNAFVSKLTNGNSAIAIVAAGILYTLVKPYFSFVMSIPATLSRVVLDILAVVVPTVIGAVPTIVEVALGLLILVEVINLLKKVVK